MPAHNSHYLLSMPNTMLGILYLLSLTLHKNPTKIGSIPHFTGGSFGSERMKIFPKIIQPITDQSRFKPRSLWL